RSVRWLTLWRCWLVTLAAPGAELQPSSVDWSVGAAGCCRRQGEIMMANSAKSSSPSAGADLADHPRVSVVIPTRDRPRLLMRAIASAQAQTVTDIEIVVVIDGPDMETGAAMGQVADRRVKVLQLNNRGGPSRARNAGCDAAMGEWIAFLDDD